MSLDIAPSAPSAPSAATAGPPGAGPPTPANIAEVFAALLTRQGRPPAGRAPTAGPTAADTTPTIAPNSAEAAREEKARNTHSDPQTDTQSAQDALDNSGLLSALPTQAAAQAALLISPGPPANSVHTAEAMDTSLASAPAPSGAAPLLPGGELLPQTVSTSPAANGAPAPFALPAAAPPSAATTTPQLAAVKGQEAPPPEAWGDGAGQAPVALTASGKAALSAAASRNWPDSQSPGPPGLPVQQRAAGRTAPVPATTAGTAASAATKTAAQEYAQFGQTALQNTSRPANNTGINAQATARGGAAAAGNAVQSSLLPVTLSPAGSGDRSMQDWAGTRIARTDEVKDKEANGADSTAAFPLPAPAAAVPGDTKTAAAAPLPSPAGRAALMQQAADSVQTLHAQVLGHGRGQMTLQLHPQDWGKLQVSVTMTPSGAAGGGTLVVAHVVADSAAVKQALEAGNADLRRTLHEAGLHLESLTITVRAASGEAASAQAGGSGERTPGQDAQAWPAPGSRSDNAGGAFGANGQTLSGGNGGQGGARNPHSGQASLLRSGLPDDSAEPSRSPALPSHAPGRLDTRA